MSAQQRKHSNTECPLVLLCETIGNDFIFVNPLLSDVLVFLKYLPPARQHASDSKHQIFIPKIKTPDC